MVFTVLPWHHDSELAFVRDCFYPDRASSSNTAVDIYSGPNLDASLRTTSTHAKDYNRAVRIVSVWNFRSPKTVPHAVTATKELIEAKLHDKLPQEENGYTSLALGPSYQQNLSAGTTDDPSVPSPSATRFVYAMAFIRFVNGFVDRDVSRATYRTGLSRISNPTTSDDESDEEGRNGAAPTVMKGTGESSMYAHAATIGMSAQFVDLRHRCVHGEIPEIRELRRMNEKALEWLWERWWKENATGDPGRYIWEMEMQEQLGRNDNPQPDGDVIHDAD